MVRRILLLRSLFVGLCLISGTRIVFSAIPSTHHSTECDSVFLSNGTVYAVKNVAVSETDVFFSYCNDPENKILTAPWQQIRYIKKADGSMVNSPVYYPSGYQLSADEKRLENEVNGLKMMAVLSIPAVLLFAVGLFLAAAVLIRGPKLRRAIAGHPNEAQLRKTLKKAMKIARNHLLFWLGIGLIGFGYLIYFFTLFNKI